ncbi:MAG: N-carbamoylputrescine amidase, partial [Alphaproteobacteria bacterium]|nr:N-carbamoylputrescine amidase [Alphaproteobacteria bacterium]
MTKVTVAALQLAFTDDMSENIDRVATHVAKAAARGAKIILPPELFEGPYFCRVEDEALFARAQPVDEHPAVQEMRKLAKDLGVYIPT